jgi:predicted RNA-binding Zn ribbon-like protein
MDGIELAGTGDHPALNFVNTRLRPFGQQLDLLDSGSSLVDWMHGEGLVDDDERRAVLRRFTAAELDAAAGRARDLRSSLVTEVASWSQGAPLGRGMRTTLNEILATDQQYVELAGSADGATELRTRRRWVSSDQLLAPVAVAAAELFAHGDPTLVRNCDGPRCVIWFYDRTRSHRRRWCSQAVCGNRDKVRNHRARVAAEQ